MWSLTNVILIPHDLSCTRIGILLGNKLAESCFTYRSSVSLGVAMLVHLSKILV